MLKYPSHLLFCLLLPSLQLTAPKSWVLPALDSSLHQVTRHPTSLHPSIVARPTQPLLTVISLGAGPPVCLTALPPCTSVSTSIHCTHSSRQTHSANPFTPSSFFHNCISLLSSVSAASLLSSISFSPLPVNRMLSASLCRFCCTARCDTKAFVGLPQL